MDNRVVLSVINTLITLYTILFCLKYPVVFFITDTKTKNITSYYFSVPEILLKKTPGD